MIQIIDIDSLVPFESTICTIASSFVSSFIITGMLVTPNALQASARLCPLIISYLPAGKGRAIIGSSNPFSFMLSFNSCCSIPLLSLNG